MSLLCRPSYYGPLPVLLSTSVLYTNVLQPTMSFSIAWGNPFPLLPNFVLSTSIHGLHLVVKFLWPNWHRIGWGRETSTPSILSLMLRNGLCWVQLNYLNIFNILLSTAHQLHQGPSCDDLYDQIERKLNERRKIYP